MSPDFADQARHAFDSFAPDDKMPDARMPQPDPPNKSLFWITAAIVSVAALLVLGLSLPCDHEFWGGIKVGLGAVCK